MILFTFILFQNTCYELLCPFGKYPWYGKCEKKFSGLKDVCLCAIFYVEVLLDPAMQHMDNDTLDHYLYDAMADVLIHTLKIAKWNETNCEVKSYIARTRNRDELYPAYNVSLSIGINGSCDLYDITENIMNYQLGGTTVKLVNDTILDLSIKINIKDKDDKEGFNTCWAYNRCFGVMRLDNVIVCPQIGLTFSDAERFSTEQRSERATFLSFFDSKMTSNRMTTVWVCLEDYVRIMSTPNGDYRSTPYSTVALLSILLVNLSLI